MPRRLIILGSTGSIGTQAVEVVNHLNVLHRRGEFPFEYRVVGLAAGRNAALAFEQATSLGVRHIALADRGGAGVSAPEDTVIFSGSNAAETLVREVECDLVLAAIVGVAGLPATLAAVELGRDVALANKETLVAAGGLIIPTAMKSGSKLLPVDSEHAGVWRCLLGAMDRTTSFSPPLRCGPEVARITLTASGGPFRTWTREAIQSATPAQTLRHPTWVMGPKVTVDSASLMNKALELIEAHWLFGIGADRLNAVIHPQSIVHALVEQADGSVIAHLAAPDMRSPIHAALAWPHHAPSCAARLTINQLSRLEFEEIDTRRFPAIGCALEIIRRSGRGGTVLNAANEALVQAYLQNRISFGMAQSLVTEALECIPEGPQDNLEQVLECNDRTRAWVMARIR